MKYFNITLIIGLLTILLTVISHWSDEAGNVALGGNDNKGCVRPPDHPATYEIGGTTYRYEYDAKGRVTSRIGGYSELRFEYAPQHEQPVKVIRLFRDEAGREERMESSFEYDRNNDIVSASNSEGASVKFVYDSSHRIISIQNNAGDWTDIGYDARCCNPAKVARRGLGSIIVNYDSACEIRNVDSSESPAVAMQIALQFYHMLEIVEPASMDVYR